MSQTEYESLFDARKKVGDSLYPWPDEADDPKARSLSEAARKQMQEDVKTVLGEERAKEYEWSRSWDYQQLFGMARAASLPADSARKVYSFKDAAETKAKEIRAIQDFSREQQQEALAAVRKETEAAIAATLGDKLYNSYKLDAYWLNSISYTPPPRPTATKQP